MTAARKVPRTQRAWVGEEECDMAVEPPRYLYGKKLSATFPVLVVPEAAVSECKHQVAKNAQHDWCSECGAYEAYKDRWQRPRILKVKR